MMPVMDGYTFLEREKGTPYASLPVIAVTGDPDGEAEQKVLELGAWDFVSKPYQPRCAAAAAEKRHRAQPVLSAQGDEARL
jgi:CheY-like chemotaxis protein